MILFTILMWFVLSLFLAFFIYFFLWPYIKRMNSYIKVYIKLRRLRINAKNPENKKSFKEMEDLAKTIIKKEKL